MHLGSRFECLWDMNSFGLKNLKFLAPMRASENYMTAGSVGSAGWLFESSDKLELIEHKACQKSHKGLLKLPPTR